MQARKSSWTRPLQLTNKIQETQDAQLNLKKFFFFSLSFFFFLPILWHLEVLGPGIKPTPQQWPKPQQWQHWILNPLSHQGTPIFLFFLFFFFLIAILMVWKWYPLVVLIWLSLMMSNIDYLVMCLLAICISSLEKWYSRPLPIFKLGRLLCLCWVWGVLNIFWILILYQISDLQIFSPVVCIVLLFSWQCPLIHKSL